MDSTVLAALISAVAVLASGLLTLLITGSQERRRLHDAETARDEERRVRKAERQRDECLKVAEQFYGMVDFCASLPIDYLWGDVWTIYGEQRAERFDNAVRKAVALGGPASLREQALQVLEAIPDVTIYAEYEGRDNYAQFTALLRMGGDLAADAARGGGGESEKTYANFLATRDLVAQRHENNHAERRTKEDQEAAEPGTVE